MSGFQNKNIVLNTSGNSQQFRSKIINGKYYPLVSVCTPTFNRRPFIPTMFECFKNQTYPKTCIEWIIVDDGTDKIEDLVVSSGIQQIRYFKLDKKMPLGEKRNYMHQQCNGSIIVYMDDDDYYPPERIYHCVEKLNENKHALVAGASEIYIYFHHIQKMVQCGPYAPNHATAGTFAFRKELLEQTQYNDVAALAEEKEFLKNYTIPMVQLDPLKTILVFSHSHNTFDKKKLLDNMHPEYCKESDKKVDDFICKVYEKPVKEFFLNEMEKELSKYPPGKPEMKPDVIENIKKIEKEREELMNSNKQKIFMSIDGKDPVEITIEQMVQIVENQQQQMMQMKQYIENQNTTIENLRKQIVSLLQQSSSSSQQQNKSSTVENVNLFSPPPPPQKPISNDTPALFNPSSKSQPVGYFNVSD